MRRVLNWIVGAPIAILIIGFAIANRQWQRVSFDPFSQETPFASIIMPLWALLFLGMFIGMLAGWAGCWWAQGKWRKAAREARIDLERARREIEGLRREAQPPQPGRDTPALPSVIEPF